MGDWNAKVEEDATHNWPGICGRFCNTKTNDRGLRLLEFASDNNLFLANTYGPHKPSRRWTWHSPDEEHHNQIDYILVKKRFRSGVNISRTRSFPGADIGSDHNLVMLTFHLHLKKISKGKNTRLKFDVERLKDPEVAEAFQTTIERRFAPLNITGDDDVDVETLTTTFNSTIIETANEILGRRHEIKQPWVTTDILDLCDKRRELKNEKNKAKRTKKCNDANNERQRKKLKSKKVDTEVAKEYRKINNEIKKRIPKAKEDWIGQQCTNIEDSLNSETANIQQTRTGHHQGSV
jgi:hypothetical protein